MAFSNKFWSVIAKIFPIADFVHFLQLEDYSTARYLRRLESFFFRRGLQRLESVVWTTRAKLTAVLAGLLTLVGVILVSYFYLTWAILLLYFAYNKNGPKILWWTLLAEVVVLNLGLQTLNWFDLPFAEIVWQAADYLSLLIFGNLLILVIIIGLWGKSTIPKGAHILWLVAILSVSFVLLTPNDEPILVFFKLFLWLAAFSILLIPVWVALANLVLTPVYYLARYLVHHQASAKIRQMPNLKVVVVLGSYGKTTTKNFIHQLLKFNYRIQMVPGNINTATGIARWILANLEEYTEILLVEADGYDAKEYSDTGKILRPDYLVLTNIGDQHLERFGSRQKLAKAMLRLCQAAKDGASVIMSSMTIEDLACWRIDYTKRLTGKNLVQLDLTAELRYRGTKLQLGVLSPTNRTNLRFALKIAEFFDIPATFVADTACKLELPERRQAEIELFGFTTLDDSYNISPTTAKAAIEQAAKRAKELKKKLVIIFAGIPELGNENTWANREIASLLAKKAAFVVLLSTNLIADTQKALDRLNFTKVHLAGRMSEAWEFIRSKFKPKTHYVLMLPELNDLYYEL